MMRSSRAFSDNRGATLVEVLISAAIVLTLVAASAVSVLNCQYFASYSRHKTQAVFAAQQIIEQLRRQNFTTASSTSASAVQLDNYGSTVPAPGYFYGIATTTMTNIDQYRNHVDVEINWTEQMLAGKIHMKEYYSTNIANDPIPN